LGLSPLSKKLEAKTKLIEAYARFFLICHGAARAIVILIFSFEPPSSNFILKQLYGIHPDSIGWVGRLNHLKKIEQKLIFCQDNSNG
jgi:hypothetical protein